MARKQFSFYRAFYETIEKLPTMKEKVQAYELLCDFALNETEPDLSGKSAAVAMVFRVVRPNLESAHKRSRTAIRRREVLTSAECKPEYVEQQQEEDEVLL